MPNWNLSPQISLKLQEIFPRELQAAAVVLLETQCGHELPMAHTQGMDGIERIRCAVMKLSEGSLEKLDAAVQLAKQDWRDVLVAADFANDAVAHIAWRDRQTT